MAGEPRTEELIELLRLTYRVYEVWWNQVGTFDPGSVLMSDGTRLDGIAGLIDHEDNDAMDEACLAIEPQATRIKQLIDELPAVPSSKEPTE
jgi:hypothetical protein